MQIEARESNGVVILDLDGRLAAGVSDEMLPQAMDVLLSDGYRRILINLSKVDFVDSMGLGDIVHSCRKAREHGASVKLLNPQTRVRKLLQLTNVSTVFEILDSEEEAVSSFEQMN